MVKILVASDLSARSDRAVARSFALAKQLNAELIVLHVVDADLPEDLRNHTLEWAHKALSREIETLETSTGVKFLIEVGAGHPSSEIAARADAAKADLVVLGVHNQATELRKIFSETTAGKIARATRAPILLVKGDARARYQSAVIGIDFSALSRAAFRQALRIAPAARFYLVHAYHVPFKAFISDPRLSREIVDALNDQMELIGEWAKNAGISVDALEKILREGEPLHILYAECSRLKADLIVVGTHGATGVGRAIWGSIAADLLDAPPCDVLIAKPYWS
jgi:nucleotide-binding universal stress UspA family protein